MGDRTAHIASVGTALPGPPIDNRALARIFGMDEVWHQWVDTFIGTSTRHSVIDLETRRPAQTLAGLAETACRRALESAALAPADIDLVIMGTAMPDMLMPATVNVVADRLGVDNVPTYQLQSGCAGAFQALDLARDLLLVGRHGTALVIGGDVCVKHVDFDAAVTGLGPAELVNLVLFGDGAGAAVVSVEPTPGCAAIRHLFTRLTGLNRPPGHILQWYGPGGRASGEPAAAEDYRAIEELVPVMSEEILGELLDGTDWKEPDIDYLLPPQLSGRMTRRIVERLGIDHANEITLVSETGNIGNATPFFQLELALTEMARGDRAVAISVESSKWIKAGLALERI
jgi:3-oxoacyl-[acyl-carrier-protein] synthase-3